MSPDLIDCAVANGAKGIVIAGVGNGNMNKASVDAAASAVKKGVVVVRSSRVPTGIGRPQRRARRRRARLHRVRRTEPAEGADSPVAGAAETSADPAGSAGPVLHLLTRIASNWKVHVEASRSRRAHCRCLLSSSWRREKRWPNRRRQPSLEGRSRPRRLRPRHRTRHRRSTIELTAGDDEVPTPKRNLIKWNHYDGDFFTIRAGGGFLEDFAAYSQDEASKEQFPLFPESGSGMRGSSSVAVSSSSATLSPGAPESCTTRPTEKFLVRQTGVMFTVPEISGYILVGRQKEGSLSTRSWSATTAGRWNERRSATRPFRFLPTASSGSATRQEKHLLWNLGAFGDTLSEGQSFSSYSHQFVGRIAWLPDENEETVLHIGAATGTALPSTACCSFVQGPRHLRPRSSSTPETFQPRALTTVATSRPTTGLGSFLIGTEYFVQSVDAPETGNPFFQGGDVVVTWLATGETRPTTPSAGSSMRSRRRARCFRADPERGNSWRTFSYADLNSGPDTRREVLEIHADGQLVSLGQCAARDRLRLWFAPSLRPRRDDAVFSDPASTAAVIQPISSKNPHQFPGKTIAGRG